MHRRTLGAWRAFLTSSTAWVVNPMGEKSTVRRCQPHGLLVPWGLVCTANIVNRMGVTSVVNSMGEKLTLRGCQPHGSSAPWGLVCTANIVNRMGVTSVVNPMGEKLTIRRCQPRGSSAPWGEHVFYDVIRMGIGLYDFGVILRLINDKPSCWLSAATA